MGRKSAVCGHVHMQVCSVSPGRGARTGDLVRLAGVCSSRHSLREAVPCSVRPRRWPCCEVSGVVALSRAYVARPTCASCPRLAGVALPVRLCCEQTLRGARRWRLLSHASVWLGRRGRAAWQAKWGGRWLWRAHEYHVSPAPPSASWGAAENVGGGPGAGATP